MKKLIIIIFINLFNNFLVSQENNNKNAGNKNMQNIFLYKEKLELKPSGLAGITDNQINDHWKLYVGYVNNVNKINEELKDLTAQGKASSLIYADRRRRYGFEYNGMILHEYYFENLTNNQKLNNFNNLDNSKLKEKIISTWGSFENWLEDFKNTGKTRGIGWAILYTDPKTGELTNQFVHEHQNGVITDFKPILVLDVWEHAYMVDHKADGRGAYIEAFIKNVNWDIVNNRYK
jgi:Fe-Mn family superoxide dismutase